MSKSLRAHTSMLACGVGETIRTQVLSRCAGFNATPRHAPPRQAAARNAIRTPCPAVHRAAGRAGTAQAMSTTRRRAINLNVGQAVVQPGRWAGQAVLAFTQVTPGNTARWPQNRQVTSLRTFLSHHFNFRRLWPVDASHGSTFYDIFRNTYDRKVGNKISSALS